MLDKLTIIIPAFNEEKAIGTILEAIQVESLSFVHEVIVINDGSNDSTSLIAVQKGAKVINHVRNMGYGAAIKTGIRHADTEYVLTMDADGQHRASSISDLWYHAHNSDMVVGQRQGLLKSTLWRMPGKWFLSKMANYLSHTSIPDLNSGFRIIRKDVAMRYLHVCPQGFSFSTTITMSLITQGYTVNYVPIEVDKRIGKSTVSITTGLSTIILIMRIASLFNPLRIYIPVSIFLGISGLFWGIPYIIAGHGISIGAMLAIFTSILFFGLGLICDQISQLRLEAFH